MTLGDEEARRRGTQKTTLERKAPPTFDVVVEIQSWERVAIHDNVAHVVDAWLRGYPIAPEGTVAGGVGEVTKAKEVGSGRESSMASVFQDPGDNGKEELPSGATSTRVFLFGVGRERVEHAADAIGVPIDVVSDLRTAEVVLTTKTHYRRGSQVVRAAEKSGQPIYVLRKNTSPQVSSSSRRWRGSSTTGASWTRDWVRPTKRHDRC